MARKAETQKDLFSVGSEVWIDLGDGDPVPARVLEDRGPVGIGGRRILRVELQGEPDDDPPDLEIPVDDLVPPPALPSGLPSERHVVPATRGGWAVIRPGRTRASGFFHTKSEAVKRAREIVQNSGGGEVVIHTRDGRIVERDAYGRDPTPPRHRGAV